MIPVEKRDLLSDLLPDNSLVIVNGWKLKVRSNDTYYPFRQHPDMLLLTGVNSPDILLIVSKIAGRVKVIVYSDSLSGNEKVWWTDRVSQEEAGSLSGIDDIRSWKSWPADIRQRLKQVERIYIGWEKFHSPLLNNHKDKLSDFRSLTKPLRLIKTEEEIEKIKWAIEVTHEAYDLVKTSIRPGMYEYEIEALIAGVFRKHHMTEAYPTIVGSGPNACTLHYTKHTRKIQDGDFVLIDFGAECDGYAADITRTFAVGNVSPRQKEVYESVLAVKQYAESIVRPGITKLQYNQMVRTRMNQELRKLWLIPEGASKEQEHQLSLKYYPHSVGHFLGLDVHDVGDRDEVLKPGMTITCEPGIYIPEEGIGVRLEDDLLVTETGCINLSKEIPL